jgi:hypothetical protein
MGNRKSKAAPSDPPPPSYDVAVGKDAVQAEPPSPPPPPTRAERTRAVVDVIRQRERAFVEAFVGYYHDIYLERLASSTVPYDQKLWWKAPLDRIRQGDHLVIGEQRAVARQFFLSHGGFIDAVRLFREAGICALYKQHKGVDMLALRLL